MAITAMMVKDLRERTSAGMMDCKKALMETDGDMDKAIEHLREKGLAKAAKKAGRIASEGLVKLGFSEDGKVASAVEVNSETDFVAKNEEFIQFVTDLAKLALEGQATDLESFMATNLNGTETVQDVLNAKIAKIGENMHVRRFERLEKEGVVYVGYSHGAGKIGVLIGLETTATLAEVSTLGKDVAMQVASMNPKFVGEADVDPDWLEEEKKIAIQLLLNEGKPEKMMDKIIPGKVKAILKEVCLVDQKFVKNSDLTVNQYVAEVAKTIGKEIKIDSMLRFEVGEGLEKKEENFAEEVAKQIGN